MRPRWLFVVLALTLVPAIAGAQGMQKWRTKDGRIIYGNQPPPGAEVLDEFEAAPPIDRGSPKAPSRSLVVDRVWSEPEVGYGYALVTYRNTDEKTYESATVQCIALARAGDKINTNSGTFWAHEYGPIRPGFEETIKVPVELSGRELDSMRCSVRER